MSNIFPYIATRIGTLIATKLHAATWEILERP